MAVSVNNTRYDCSVLIVLYSLPIVEATVNDTIVVNINNQLDTFTSLHTHGIFQNGSVWMDGPIGVTQW